MEGSLNSKFLCHDRSEEKTWCGRLVARRMELLIGASVLMVVIVTLGIGLGGEH